MTPLRTQSKTACFLSMLALLVATTACESDQRTVIREPEFTAEGVLDFLSASDSVIVRIAIELAETRTEQTTGLMARRSLPNRGGMLFVYDREQDQSFWMKNTPLPLDIIFIGRDSSIINIAKRTRPLSEDNIRSTRPAQYVLEVRAGFTDRYGIDETTTVRWQRLEEGA